MIAVEYTVPALPGSVDHAGQGCREPRVAPCVLAVEPSGHEVITNLRADFELAHIELIPRLFAQLRKEHHLGASVPFPEAMDHLELAPHFSKLTNKRRVVEATQKIVGSEPAELCISRFGECWTARMVSVPVLGHEGVGTYALFTSPFIDVLKQITMYGFEVPVVECSTNRMCGQLDQTNCDS